VVLEEMNDTERLAALEERFRKLKLFANQIVAELNATQDRVAALEAKLKTLIP